MIAKEVRYERLRPDQVVAELAHNPVVYLPLGPLEWHGPHLPFGTDPLIAYAVALRAAEKTGGVVLPAFFWGTEGERSEERLRRVGFKGREWVVGMDFPANSLKSLYVREEYFALMVRGMLDALERQGFRLIVVVNGHGAANHRNVLERLRVEYTAKGQSRVLNLFAWVEGDTSVREPGHACAIETSRMRLLYPETVDLSTLPPIEQPLYNLDWGILDRFTVHGQPADDFRVREDPRAGIPQQEAESSLLEAVANVVRVVEQALNELGLRQVTWQAASHLGLNDEP